MLTSQDLKKYSYFSGLSTASLDELASKLVSVCYPDGEVIIKQGTPPDYFYFLLEGEVTIKRRNKFGQRGIMNVLSSGQAFGEVAMLTCSHRTCSVLARGNTTMLRMSKRDFEDTIMTDSAFANMLTRKAQDCATSNRLKSFQPFAMLEPEKFMALIAKLKERTYFADEFIIRQGEKGDCYYVIKEGSVTVLKEGKGNGQVKVVDLGPGEAFGEEALIRDQKRSASVKSLTDTVVLALDEKDFNGLLKASYLDFTFPEDIPLDRLGDYVFIDARIPAEYEEEHIEGAINIPIEELRQKYPELDYKHEYLTYCTNDSRGMAAAFLLRSQGFNAKNLRGGLSGWEGPVKSSSDGIHLPRIE